MNKLIELNGLIQYNEYKKPVILYDGAMTNTGVYTLADDIYNYEYLLIEYAFPSYLYKKTLLIAKEMYGTTEREFQVCHGDGDIAYAAAFHFSNTELIIDYYNQEIITKVLGIK